MKRCILAAGAALLLISPARGHAQRAPTGPPVSRVSAERLASERSAHPVFPLATASRSPAAPQDSVRRRGWYPLRIAKWTLLTGSAAAGVYGFVQSNEADDRYVRLERLCQEQQSTCRQRTSDGAYVDPEFEGLFQDVRDLDNRSHTALLIGEIGVAASVALFLLDLDNSTGPSDIPWTPARLEIMPGVDRVEVGVRVPWPLH